mmetsp:Transcript_6976/g.17283  ORF Transcript_6976/g.17283 Transcript_6976/m.17283 type:complete len:377 (+) Transcript_6976:708-1838(+)
MCSLVVPSGGRLFLRFRIPMIAATVTTLAPSATTTVPPPPSLLLLLLPLPPLLPALDRIVPDPAELGDVVVAPAFFAVLILLRDLRIVVLLDRGITQVLSPLRAVPAANVVLPIPRDRSRGRRGQLGQPVVGHPLSRSCLRLMLGRTTLIVSPAPAARIIMGRMIVENVAGDARIVEAGLERGRIVLPRTLLPVPPVGGLSCRVRLLGGEGALPPAVEVDGFEGLDAAVERMLARVCLVKGILQLVQSRHGRDLQRRLAKARLPGRGDRFGRRRRGGRLVERRLRLVEGGLLLLLLGGIAALARSWPAVGLPGPGVPPPMTTVRSIDDPMPCRRRRCYPRPCPCCSDRPAALLPRPSPRVLSSLRRLPWRHGRPRS